MNLSTEQYTALLHKLRSLSPAPQPAGESATDVAERRRTTRTDFRTRIQIRCCSPHRRAGQDWIEVSVRNFSPRGMCVLNDKGLPPGDQFIARLPGDNGDAAEILCSVVHCGPITKGVFSIGAEFIRVLGKTAGDGHSAVGLQTTPKPSLN